VGKPVVDFTASKTTPATFEDISLIDLSSNGSTSWTWRISPATFIWMNGSDSNSRFPKVKFTNADDYSVQLICSNANGSSALMKTDYIRVMFSNLAKAAATDDALILYPVPAADWLQIEYHKEILDISIYTIEGKLVMKDVKNTKVDIRSLKDGIYVTIVRTRNGCLRKTFTLIR
jgi:hypothetical protein